jgi:hypothetical protein
MNKKNSFVLFIVVMLITLVILTIGFVKGVISPQNCNYYAMNSTVVEVKEQLITVEDYSGNLWQFEGNSWSVGDRCNCVMYDNKTEMMSDDEIISARHD